MLMMLRCTLSANTYRTKIKSKRHKHTTLSTIFVWFVGFPFRKLFTEFGICYVGRNGSVRPGCHRFDLLISILTQSMMRHHHKLCFIIYIQQIKWITYRSIRRCTSSFWPLPIWGACLFCWFGAFVWCASHATHFTSNKLIHNQIYQLVC